MRWKEMLGKVQFYEGTGKLFDHLLLAVLWVAGMVPVITAGASCSAFYDTFHKCILKGEGYVLMTFADSYRDNLKYGIVGTVMLALLVFILGTNIGISTSFLKGDLKTAVFWFYVLLMALAAGFFVYLFALISRFRMKLGWLVKAALYLEIKNPLGTAVLVAIVGADLFLIRMSPVFLVAAPCISAAAIHKLIEPLMEKLYMPKKEQG